MARIKIQLPKQFPYSTTIRVRITDLNYGGHLAHDRLISLLHEARQQYFKWMGYCEQNLEGLSMVVSDLAVQYKSEAFEADELLIEMAPDDISKVGFDVYYKVTAPKSDKLVAHAKTGITLFCFRTHKMQRLPLQVKEKLVAQLNLLGN